MIETILGLAKAALSIWDKKLAVKYQVELLKLTKERDEILQGTPKYNNKVDYNELDRVDRDILRLGSIVATEIAGSKA